MPSYSFTAPRLFVQNIPAIGQALSLEREQSHYLLNVMRLRDGEQVLLFDGQTGEWLAKLTRAGRKEARLQVEAQTRPQNASGKQLTKIDYCFAPLKQARLDYMVQKAVEMGASSLTPVLTARTQVRKLNLERIKANIIEAAEQCGVLHLAACSEPVSFDAWLNDMPSERLVVFCDERADGLDGQAELKTIAVSQTEISLIIGPEGGFDDGERSALKARPNTIILSLGPRILRADTAAVAALAIVQSLCGDWRDQI